VGIGIRNSLAPVYATKRGESAEDWDDLGAIRLALTKGVTRLTGSSPGDGLWLVTQFVERYRGSLLVRSGRGKITITRQSNKARRVLMLPGTQLVLSIPTGYIRSKRDGRIAEV